jgi:hypothetical protein
VADPVRGRYIRAVFERGKRYHRPAAITVALLAILVTALLATRDTRPRGASRPMVWLWSWEHFDDFRFLEGQKAGVAYLAATVRLDSAGATWQGRAQNMRLVHGLPLLPVVRLEGSRALNDSARHELVTRLVAVARGQGDSGLQIDWDAPRSSRPAYTALLQELRVALPDTLPLSVTALASWCTGDCWLEGAPVDEVVPMVFRMGADEARVRADLQHRGDFACRACRQAVGLSVDEADWPSLRARRVYLFSPRPWTGEIFERALERWDRSRK